MKNKMTRQEANRNLVKVINAFVETYPDWRFGQILSNAGVITRKQDSPFDIKDPFYEESTETWERIKKVLNITEDEDINEKEN